jgi:hypothetical protein
MRIRLLVFAIGVAAVRPLAAEPVPLRAGLARVEVTPPDSMPMYGYSNRKCGPSSGTHDPLEAKVVVLATGDTRIAIVTLDLGSFVSDTVQKEAAEKLGIPVVLLASSHTHSAPQFPMTPEASTYREETERKILSAIGQASSTMFPARLEMGPGSIRLGYNRLLPRDDGRTRALFDNLERVPYGPVDPELVLLRIADDAGKARALMVHYAAHAVVLGPTNCKYSADYPGVMQARVEAALPGIQCMFVQGGAGDINPLFQGRTGREEEDFATTRKMGELLADEVVRANRTVRPVGDLSGPIQFKRDLLRFADRWDKTKSLEVGITTVLVGREIAIAAVPGEPMHKLQTTWKQRAEVPHPLFYGYTTTSGHPWPGYIPDLRSAAHGGYGADASTRIEVGAGEAIMERHLINLYGLLGMWRDAPGRP